MVELSYGAPEPACQKAFGPAKTTVVARLYRKNLRSRAMSATPGLPVKHCHAAKHVGQSVLKQPAPGPVKGTSSNNLHTF